MAAVSTTFQTRMPALKLQDQGTVDLTQAFSLLKVPNMKTGVRNQWVGRVSAIRIGVVNDEGELSLPSSALLSVIVTRDSADALARGLR
jgi:molybdopterin-binding protein